MATLNFPNTLGQPTDGSFTYIENDVIYSWNGTYWSANNATDLDNRYVNVTGDTMTGDLTVPNLESAGDIQSTSQNGGPLAGFRNHIINGDFRIWQRGDGPIQAQIEMLFGPDRWRNFSNSNNQLYKLHTKGTTPPGFDYACRVYNTNAGYSGTLGIAQPIELDRAGGRGGPFTKGSTWTYSCISNAPSLNLDVFFGMGSAGLTDSIVADQAMTQTAYDGSWFKYIYQITFPNSDPNATADCLVVRPRTTGQGSWDITGCQLEPGLVSTEFEHRPIGTELALCQRYFIKTSAIWCLLCIRSKNSGGAGSAYGFYQYQVPMRSAPTFTAVGSWLQDAEGGSGNPRADLIGTSTCRLVTTKAYQATAETVVTEIRSQSSANEGYFEFDAEL